MNNKIVTDYSLVANKPLQIMHQRDQYKQKYSVEMDYDLEDTTDHQKSLYYSYGLDLSLTNHKSGVDADTHAISGVYNNENAYVLEFVCHTALSTDCDLVVCLHYNSIMESNNGAIKITE
jgi:hypothetical protein